MKILFKNIFQLLNWNSLFLNKTDLVNLHNIKIFIEKFNTVPTPYRSGRFIGFIEGI